MNDSFESTKKFLGLIVRPSRQETSLLSQIIQENNSLMMNSFIHEGSDAMLSVMFWFQISVILSIYRAVEVGKKGGSGGIYFLLGASLLGFVAIQVFMVRE